MKNVDKNQKIFNFMVVNFGEFTITVNKMLETEFVLKIGKILWL